MRLQPLTTVLVLFLVLFAVSCSAGAEEPVNHTVTDSEQAVLNLVLQDLSISALDIEVPLKSWQEYWIAEVASGGMQLALIEAKSSSLAQRPFFSDLIKLDTQQLEGSRYERFRIRQQNQARIDSVGQSLSILRDSLARRMIKPRNESHTDLNGAFLHLGRIANNYYHLGYSIRLILFTDLLQDTETETELRPLQLPDGTEVFVIGAAPGKTYEALFPGAKVQAMSVFRPELIYQKNLSYEHTNR